MCREDTARKDTARKRPISASRDRPRDVVMGMLGVGSGVELWVGEVCSLISIVFVDTNTSATTLSCIMRTLALALLGLLAWKPVARCFAHLLDTSERALKAQVALLMAPAANFICAPVRAVPLELVVRARLQAGSRMMSGFAAVVAAIFRWWLTCRLPRRLHVCNAAIATLILVHLRVHITAARVTVCMHNGRRLHLCDAAIATLIFVHFRVDVTGTRVAVKHRRPLLTCTVIRDTFLCHPFVGWPRAHSFGKKGLRERRER